MPIVGTTARRMRESRRRGDDAIRTVGQLRIGCFAAALASCLAAPASWAAAPPPLPDGPCKVVRQTNVSSRMRDGTILLADVYIPVAPGTFPVLLMRLPYNKSVAQTYVYHSPEWYASQCYVVAVQDVRGTYASTGDFYPFRNEQLDGYDSVEWAAGLPASNGKVGMYGFSYVGATQWLAAMAAPPHLAAIAPAMTSSDYFDGWAYQGGAFSLAFDESWPVSDLAPVAARRSGIETILDKLNEAKADITGTYRYLPIASYPWLFPDKPQIAGYFYDWVSHSTWDNYWKQWSPKLHYADVKVPALNLEGWYDVFLNGGIENFMGMRKQGGSPAAREGQQLVIGPYVHLPWQRKTGAMDFGPEADNRFNERQLRFFDHWLKGKPNGADKDPPVQVFVMGANTWRDATDWPIPGTQFTTFYLHSYGSANSSDGNGWLDERRPFLEAADRYVYDPANPVPSKGGHSCCREPLAPVGPYDQSAIEKRADVMVYSTPPLEKPVEVTGPITLTLYASTSAEDTDWTAKLVDVYPDGRAINLNNGILRARYRISLEHTELLTPDKVYRYTINIWPTSNLFGVGHRIRLEMSSSNFPHYSRNLNTGDAFGLTAQMTTASQAIFHNRHYPSALILPIMPQPVTAKAVAARQ